MLLPYAVQTPLPFFPLSKETPIPAVRSETLPVDLLGRLTADGVPPDQGQDLGSPLCGRVTWSPFPHLVPTGIPFSGPFTFFSESSILGAEFGAVWFEPILSLNESSGRITVPPLATSVLT